MSVYSRCVEARGATSIESTPAAGQPSKPVRFSRRGSGPSGEGSGLSELLPLSRDGETVKPYSDWTASAGTTGRFGVPAAPGAKEPLASSLSSATTAATRRSVACTLDTAAAPIEWPMMASRMVRPGVAVRLSLRRSNHLANGLCPSTAAPADPGLPYGCPGVEVKKSMASSVPTTKFDSCWKGTPGQPNISPSRGGANGLQNGSALSWL